MKISKQYLKNIILEELQSLMSEIDNPVEKGYSETGGAEETVLTIRKGFSVEGIKNILKDRLGEAGIKIVMLDSDSNHIRFKYDNKGENYRTLMSVIANIDSSSKNKKGEGAIESVDTDIKKAGVDHPSTLKK